MEITNSDNLRHYPEKKYPNTTVNIEYGNGSARLNPGINNVWIRNIDTTGNAISPRYGIVINVPLHNDIGNISPSGDEVVGIYTLSGIRIYGENTQERILIVKYKSGRIEKKLRINH